MAKTRSTWITNNCFIITFLLWWKKYLDWIFRAIGFCLLFVIFLLWFHALHDKHFVIELCHSAVDSDWSTKVSIKPRLWWLHWLRCGEDGQILCWEVITNNVTTFWTCQCFNCRSESLNTRNSTYLDLWRTFNDGLYVALDINWFNVPSVAIKLCEV